MWEIAAEHGVLGKVICPPRPLINHGANLRSVKDQQDDPDFLSKVYGARGYGVAAPG